MNHLITFTISYEEKFDVSGFTVFTNEEVEEHFKCIEWLRKNASNTEITFAFDNGQIVVFPNVAAIEECFTIKAISDKFAEILWDKFNTLPFGIFLDLVETMPEEYYNEDDN